MKIIKEGRFVAKCKFCKSKLEYDKYDIRIGHYFTGESQKYIICPICCEKIIVKCK